MRRKDRTNPNVDLREDALFVESSPEDMVDRLLDRDLHPAHLAHAESHIASSSDATQKLTSIRSILDDLRTPVDTPDLSSRIITEVGARRRWLAPSWQRIVTSSRLALAATFLAACAVVLVVQRVEPNAAIFPDEATPLTNVVRSSTADASAGLAGLTNMLTELPAFSAPQAPVRQAGATRVVRLDQPMQIFRIQIGQPTRISSFDLGTDSTAVMRFEFRPNACKWTVGSDDDSQQSHRWSQLTSNNR